MIIFFLNENTSTSFDLRRNVKFISIILQAASFILQKAFFFADPDVSFCVLSQYLFYKKHIKWTKKVVYVINVSNKKDLNSISDLQRQIVP